MNELERLAARAVEAAEAARLAAAQATAAAAEAAELASGSENAVVTGLTEVVAAQAGVDPTVFRLAIFVLACFVGYYVVWSVTPALHTPLMSVTNAISSVIVVGALLAVGAEAVDVMLVAPDAGLVAEADMGGTGLSKLFGFIALVLASINIFGGFLVTQRMLAMYKKK